MAATKLLQEAEPAVRCLLKLSFSYTVTILPKQPPKANQKPCWANAPLAHYFLKTLDRHQEWCWQAPWCPWSPCWGPLSNRGEIQRSVARVKGTSNSDREIFGFHSSATPLANGKALGFEKGVLGQQKTTSVSVHMGLLLVSWDIWIQAKALPPF